MIGELSVGELQRALFARLILQNAVVILVDEPFAAVDAQTMSVLLDQSRGVAIGSENRPRGGHDCERFHSLSLTRSNRRGT